MGPGHHASLTRDYFAGELEELNLRELAGERREQIDRDPDWQSRRAQQIDAEIARRGLTDADLEDALRAG